MKMMLAGINGEPENFLFNCTRNPSCQRTYYIPITSLTDIQLFFDFTFGKPEAYIINIITCDGVEIPLSWCSFVIGQYTDDNWYGIFDRPEQSDSIVSNQHFFISAEFVFEGFTYKYFSNQLKIEDCGNLVEVSSCYNDTNNQQDAFDCNGVYYQYHAGTSAGVGNQQLRYRHRAYVRRGQVIENKNQLTFTLFNSRTAYKNSVTKEYLFEFELIPTFYKDILLAVFNRGNILIDGVSYTLTESQDIGIIDTDSKLWKMDISLTNKCGQYFSCTPTLCEPIECGPGTPTDPDPCCDPAVIDATVATPDICCDPTVIDATVEEGTTPPPAVVQWGAFIGDQTISNAQKVTLQNNFGTTWGRSEITLTGFNGVSKLTDTYYSAGINNIVNLTWQAPQRDSNGNRIPNSFPTDMVLYESRLRTVLDKYYKKIKIAAIENEATNDTYWGTAPISAYLTELAKAIEVCHEYGVLVCDSAIHIVLVSGVMQGGSLNANEAQVQQLINGFASLDLDYVNFHTFGSGTSYTPAGSIQSTAQYVRDQTGHEVISNEMNIHTASTSLLTSMMDGIIAADYKIAVFRDSGEANLVTLHNPGTTNLNSMGIAFRDKILISV